MLELITTEVRECPTLPPIHTGFELFSKDRDTYCKTWQFVGSDGKCVHVKTNGDGQVYDCECRQFDVFRWCDHSITLPIALRSQAEDDEPQFEYEAVRIAVRAFDKASLLRQVDNARQLGFKIVGGPLSAADLKEEWDGGYRVRMVLAKNEENEDVDR